MHKIILILSLALLSNFSWGRGSSAPIANFKLSTTSGPSPLVINMNASASYLPGYENDRDRGILSCSWTVNRLGSSKTTIQSSNCVSHLTISDIGTSIITLTVTSIDNQTASVTQSVNVYPGAPGVVANFTLSTGVGNVPFDLGVDASLSYLPGYQNIPGQGILTCSWELLLSGKSEKKAGECATSIPVTIAGEYTIRLEVLAIDGSKASLYKTFKAIGSTSSAPVADFIYNQVDTTIFFDSSSSYPQGHISLFEWNFGDGQTSNEPNPSHTYSNTGLFTVSLKITHEYGQSNTIVKIVNLSGNEPPVAQIRFDRNGGEVPLLVHFNANASSDDRGIVSYHWYIDNGDTISGAGVDYTFTEERIYTVILTVTDEQGLSDSDSVLVFSGSDVPGDDHPEESPGILSFMNNEEHQFNSLQETLELELIGANFAEDQSAFSVRINEIDIAPEKWSIVGNTLTLTDVLSDGENDVQIIGSDSNEKVISYSGTIWAGSRSVSLNITDNLNAPTSGANLTLRVLDGQKFLTNYTASTDSIVLENLPELDIELVAQLNNSFETDILKTTDSNKTIRLQGFGVLSTIDNNDFSKGLEGWDVSGATVELVAHEDKRAVLPFVNDRDARISSVNGSLQVLKRTTNAVVGKRSFGAEFKATLQRGDYIQIVLRNQTNGKVSVLTHNFDSLNSSIQTGGNQATELINHYIETTGSNDIVQTEIYLRSSLKKTGTDLLIYLLNQKIAFAQFIPQNYDEDENNAALSFWDGELQFLSLGFYVPLWGSIQISAPYFTGIKKIGIEVWERDVFGNKNPIANGNSQGLLNASIPGMFNVSDKFLLQDKLFLVNRIREELLDYKLSIDLVITYIAGGEERFQMASGLDPLYYSSVSSNGATDVRVGGDKWSTVKTFNFIKEMAGSFWVNDVSKAHGGRFRPHESHRHGNGIDFGNYKDQTDLSPRKYNLKEKKSPLNATKKINSADAVFDFLQGPKSHLVSEIFVNKGAEPKNGYSLFGGNIQRRCSADYRVLSDIVKADGLREHTSHFHVNLKAQEPPLPTPITQEQKDAAQIIVSKDATDPKKAIFSLRSPGMISNVYWTFNDSKFKGENLYILENTSDEKVTHHTYDELSSYTVDATVIFSDDKCYQVPTKSFNLPLPSPTGTANHSANFMEASLTVTPDNNTGLLEKIVVKWGEGQEETPSEHVYQEEEDREKPITFKYIYNQNRPLISNYSAIIELHDINGNIGTIVRYINVGEVKIRLDVDFISLRQRFGYFAMSPSSLHYTECPPDWTSSPRNVGYKRAGDNFSITVNDGTDTYGWNAALLPSSVPIGSKWVLRNKPNDLISWPRMVEFVPEDDLYLSGSYCNPPGGL